MKGLHYIAFILLVVGGLNWGVFGLTGWDVGQLFGGMDAAVSQIIYIVVGLAALVEVFTHKMNCAQCQAGGDSESASGSQQAGGAQGGDTGQFGGEQEQ